MSQAFGVAYLSRCSQIAVVSPPPDGPFTNSRRIIEEFLELRFLDQANSKKCDSYLIQKSLNISNTKN